MRAPRRRAAGRPRVVVMGGDARRPPGIEAALDRADLAFADTVRAMAEALEGAEVVLAWRADGDLLRSAWTHAGSLRWVQSIAAGVDRLLFPALVEADVVVTNARGVFEDAMAEYVLGLLLAFAKDLPGTLAWQRERRWEHRETERLAGARLLVVGLGPIGRAVARLARAVGMEVEGVASAPRPGDGVVARVGGPEELPRLLAGADYVVNALPLTARTRGLFDAAAFAAMKPSARFVNVGRGGTVDEEALAAALREGRLAGAALDVVQTEPLPPESPLWDVPGLLLSPHMSGDAVGWKERVVALFLDNLDRYVSGRPLRNVVDKRRGYVPSETAGEEGGR